MGDGLPADEVEEMIKMCDVDEDGQIDYQNFVSLVDDSTASIGLLNI
jgi:Ca2+-binding EF-hand superfamily protein